MARAASKVRNFRFSLEKQAIEGLNQPHQAPGGNTKSSDTKARAVHRHQFIMSALGRVAPALPERVVVQRNRVRFGLDGAQVVCKIHFLVIQAR